jgi:hypothetical protein
MSAIEKIVLRLYAERDQDLLSWLKTIPNEHGAKSVLVKATLRKGLAMVEGEKPAAVRFDAETFLDALLPPLRRLVENAIQSEIAKLKFLSVEDAEDLPASQDDMSHQLDALGEELMR